MFFKLIIIPALHGTILSLLEGPFGPIWLVTVLPMAVFNVLFWEFLEVNNED